MLLKRLSSVLPQQLVSLLPELDAVGASTTEQLTLPARQQLSSLPISPYHLDELIAHCLQLTAPQAISGDRLAEQRGHTKSAWEGWGVDGLDSLFDLDEGGIIEIAGPDRVGRSLLALHAALRMLSAHPDMMCRWIDTQGSFSSARAKNILEEFGVQDTESVMDRLRVLSSIDLEPGLFDAVARMTEECEDSTLSIRPGVLVIDQMTTFFRNTLDANTAQGHAALVTIMEHIAEMTYAHGICTILINSTAKSAPKNDLSNFSATEIRPSLGSSLTFHVDVSLLVQETGKVFGLVDENERVRSIRAPGLRGVVEVLKSRVSPAGRWAGFETDGVKLLNVVAPPEEDYRTMMMSAGIQVDGERPIHGPLRETVIP